MREKRGFGERTATRESAQPIQKYFLVFEGEKTELIYFESVRHAAQRVGVRPSIELVPVFLTKRC